MQSLQLESRPSLGGLQEKSFLLCSCVQAAQTAEVRVSARTVLSRNFVHPRGNGRLCGINNPIFALLQNAGVELYIYIYISEMHC